MKCRFTLLLVGLALAACDKSAAPDNRFAMQYPATKTVHQVDEYHGVQVADPYRWLEDSVSASEDVKNWVASQNRLTDSYLESIPERQSIRNRLQELWDFERFGIPVNAGEKYFYRYNNGLQDQDVLIVQKNLNESPRVLLDPNSWSDDGTIALADFVPSPDAKWVAYFTQSGGTDWRKVHLVNVETGGVFEDELDWIKFSPISWAPDGSGFYYSRYPETTASDKDRATVAHQSVYFHRVGTTQNEDRLVYSRADKPHWAFAPFVTSDGSHLIITVWKSTEARHQVLRQDLTDSNDRLTFLVEGFEHDYTLIGNDGDRLFFRTDRDAPRGRIVAMDTDEQGVAQWQEVVPQDTDVLVSAKRIGNKIVANYLKDARSRVEIFELNGDLSSTVKLPGIGAAFGFGGNHQDTETFFSFESFNTPTTINRLDVESGQVTEIRAPDLHFSTIDYIVRQVFFESKDGTQVPMFVAHRKDTKLDGSAPTLLVGYGGFGASMTPHFSISALAWMEMGGVYAVANIRGGGEYGKAWHKAGTVLEKQNVFDDFISAAEFLVNSNYTNSSQLAIAGRSNGGLLVAAVTNQRPELFAAVLPAVGVMDMLRFDEFSAGRFWIDDYGSPDVSEQFDALYAYSPYHNIRSGKQYPAILATTADKDDRVVPAHSFKYIAAMQRAQAGDAPVLIRVETDAGHGSGIATNKIISEVADQWAFLVENLNIVLPKYYDE